MFEAHCDVPVFPQFSAFGEGLVNMKHYEALTIMSVRCHRCCPWEEAQLKLLEGLGVHVDRPESSGVSAV